jgi:hypothetical protein
VCVGRRRRQVQVEVYKIKFIFVGWSCVQVRSSLFGVDDPNNHITMKHITPWTEVWSHLECYLLGRMKIKYLASLETLVLFQKLRLGKGHGISQGIIVPR